MTKGVVIHDRCGVLRLVSSLDHLTIVPLVVYKNSIVQMEVNNNPSVFFLKESQESILTIPCAKWEQLLLRWQATKPMHSPFFQQLMPLMEKMDPNHSVWFAKLAESQYVAFYQNHSSGLLYCCSKGCKQEFETVEKWAAHYTHRLHLSCRFQLACIKNGVIFADSTAKFKLPANKCHKQSEPPVKASDSTSYSWRSLMCTQHGQKYRAELYHRIKVYAHNQTI